jgi:hypothetical protein
MWARVGFPRVHHFKHHLHVPMWFGLWSLLVHTSENLTHIQRYQKTLSSNE